MGATSKSEQKISPNNIVQHHHRRAFHVLKNILSLLFDSLFNSIHKLISFMYTTRVLYKSAPLTNWSSRRLTSMRKKTLILDLDETLIHSKQADQYKSLKRNSKSREGGEYTTNILQVLLL